MTMKDETLKHSALLVIDMQRYFLEEDAPAYLYPPSELILNVNKLISVFRNSGRPIVFTRHAHTNDSMNGEMARWWNGELPMDGDGYSELIETLGDKPEDAVIVKTKYSGFEDTTLDEMLRSQGIDTVVICGIMTNLCVETTARHAFMKDFQVMVVEDACATKNRAYHKASILNLSYGFAKISKTSDIIDLPPLTPPYKGGEPTGRDFEIIL